MARPNFGVESQWTNKKWLQPRPAEMSWLGLGSIQVERAVKSMLQEHQHMGADRAELADMALTDKALADKALVNVA